MTERTFNLDEILGEEAVRHYLKFITPGSQNIYGGAQYRFDSPTLGLGTVSQADDEDERHWSARVIQPQDDIEQRGSGAPLCSSSFAIATQPEFVWDVCEYYRLLGVTPWATRLELRRGFLARKGGTKARLAYALKQLLNPIIRRAYDRAVPTEPFFADKDTQERLMRKAVQQAAREAYLTGRDVTQDEVLARWGVKRNKPGEEQPLEEIADRHSLPPDPEKVAGKFGPTSTALGSTISPWTLQWSWYIWHEGAGSEYLAWDPRPLAAWQRMLRAELARKGLVISFAVGLHTGYGWKVFRSSEGMCMVFLGRGEPANEDLAAEAIEYIAKGDRRTYANEKGREGRRGIQ